MDCPTKEEERMHKSASTPSPLYLVRHPDRGEHGAGVEAPLDGRHTHERFVNGRGDRNGHNQMLNLPMGLLMILRGAFSRDNAPIEDIPDAVSAQLDFGKLADKY
jgi:hypothetical protein